MNKKTILIVLAIIVGVVGFLLLTEPSETTNAQPSEHKLGEGTSGITLVEYGDFQCPGCASYFPVLKQVKEHYGDKITFQFRHFPLESIHPNARAASRAAEAAAKQGKFWEMHDMLFERQAQWQDTRDPVATFESYASDLGLDLEQFVNDYKDQSTNATISADLSHGRSIGVSSTPTFILNNQKLDQSPAGTLDAFIDLIDAKIAELGNDDSDSDKETEDKKQEDDSNEDNE